MKIIVKLQLEPNEVKEVFEGNDLTETKTGSDDHPILVIRNGEKKLAEFTHWIYWVKEGEKDEIKKALVDRDLLLREIESIVNSEPDLGKKIMRIKDLLTGRPRTPEEPDKAALLLNLDYIESFAQKLPPSYPAETLMGAIYAVREFTEHETVPHWPIDPSGEGWSWDKFKESFKPTRS